MAIRPKRVRQRRGPFSNMEKKQIQDLDGLKTATEIALILNRSISQVEKYILSIHEKPPEGFVRKTEEEEIRVELAAQADWKLAQKEYTKEELDYYEIEYVDYRKMFKDLTKTEIKQLHQLIMLDIKIHRHNADVMQDMEDLDRMDRLLTQLYKDNNNAPLDLNDPRTIRITQLEAQRAACRTSKNARQKEHSDMLKKHSDLLVTLKSTRDQRIKDVEDRGQFIVLLKQLEEEERRQAISEIVGLMDLSVESKKKELSAYFKYSDGMLDRPFLTPESIEQMEAPIEG